MLLDFPEQRFTTIMCADDVVRIINLLPPLEESKSISPADGSGD
jgi:hypothetical protein